MGTGFNQWIRLRISRNNRFETSAAEMIFG
jgi:hypothetical protein